MAKKTAETPDPVLAELTAIKRLMVMTLLRTGASQTEVAAALGVGQSYVSGMFPNDVMKSLRAAAKDG